MMTPITVVRHAESEANRAKVLSGQTPEVPLTDLGHAQARAAGAQLAQQLRGRPVRILASPYTRTIETAQHIARALGVPEHEIVTDPALRERSFGVLEGSQDIAMHKLPGYVLMQGKKALRANEHWKPEGGESLEDVRQRVAPIIDHHVRQYPGHHHVVVTHGHVVKAMHAHAHGSWDKIPRAENADPRGLPWPVDVAEARLHEGDMPWTEAGWIAPSGEFHKIPPGHDHYTWLLAHPEHWEPGAHEEAMSRMDRGESRYYACRDGEARLLRHGWVRQAGRSSYAVGDRRFMGRVRDHVMMNYPKVSDVTVDVGVEKPRPHSLSLRESLLAMALLEGTLSVVSAITGLCEEHPIDLVWLQHTIHQSERMQPLGKHAVAYDPKCPGCVPPRKRHGA